jgi:hypothetical protein
VIAKDVLQAASVRAYPGFLARLGRTGGVFIIIFLAAILLFVPITRAQPVGEFKGSLILAFYDKGSWQTNFYSVDIQSEPSRWHLTLRSPKEHVETFADSNQVEVVSYFDNIVPTENGMNSTEISLFPTSRPLASPAEEHVWVALFSHDTFSGKKVPLDDIGLRIEEPCIFTEMQFNTNDASPRFSKWHNERADNYKNQYRIEGEFKWLAETNLSDGMFIPLKSELAINLTPPGGHNTPASFSQLTIDHITSLTSAPEFEPTIKGRSVVLDYRFGGVWGRTYVAYDQIHDGVIPGTNSPIVLKAKSQTPYFYELEHMKPGTNN